MNSEIIINEVWRPVSGHMNYQVSNIGRIRNSTTGKILKPVTNTNGYYFVCLCSNGKRTTRKIHRLVGQEFLPPPENDDQTLIDHIDRDKLNNCITNLRFVTRSQNCMNRPKQSNSTSNYKGIYRRKDNKWRAVIHKDSIAIHLGCYDTEEKAAHAYNRRASEIFGEYAFLNELPEFD